MKEPGRGNVAAFADHFSHDPDDYAAFRPRYPAALFGWVADRCLRRELAWDCATGNGQAALGLADCFDRVIATDASPEQIGRALPHPRIEYHVAPADDSGLEEGSTDLVTVAQAVHWLPRERFFAEARRVLRAPGLLAAWGYHLPQTGDAQLDREIQRFHDVVVGPFWPPERRIVMDRLATIDFPFDEIDPPPFEIQRVMTRDAFAAYLRTQSATHYYRRAHDGRDPVALFERSVAALWPEGDEREVVWPVFVRAGIRKP